LLIKITIDTSAAKHHTTSVYSTLQQSPSVNLNYAQGCQVMRVQSRIRIQSINQGIKMKKGSKTHLVNKIVASADALFNQREEFEQNEYARSNKRLYEILGQVLNMYLKASEDKTVLAETVKQLKDKLQAKNVRIQGNTLAITLFVRYVFGTGRQSSLNYSRALQAAIQQKISADELAVFIEDCGGVEACKKTFTKSATVIANETKIADSMELVEEMLIEAEQHPIANFTVPKEFVANTNSSGILFFMAKADRNGNVKALTAVPANSEGMEKWAKQKLALYLNEKKMESDKQQKEKLTKNAINVAANEVKKNSHTETVGELLEM
jgi:hypothetical protein